MYDRSGYFASAEEERKKIPLGPSFFVVSCMLPLSREAAPGRIFFSFHFLVLLFFLFFFFCLSRALARPSARMFRR